MDTYEKMLSRAVVVNPLKSSDIFGVIAELIDGLVQKGLLHETQRDAAQQAVVRREMSASTVMTDEIALPHGRVDVVQDLLCAVGIHPDGFVGEAMDGNPTRVVVMMLIPPSAGCGYIQFLANLSSVLMQPDKRAELMGAKSCKEMVKILTV